MSPPINPPAARVLRAAGEFLLVAVAALSVWPFGGVYPREVSLIAFAVLALAGLWAAHAVVTRAFEFRPDFASVGLGGIVLWSAVQLVPLPEPVVAIVSPLRAEWHRTFLPETLEQLPGEAGSVPRPTVLPLSVNPAATRRFLADALVVLVLYVVSRNWLATPAALRRLAWVAAVTGVLLAALALGQLISDSRGQIYWTYPARGGNSFGPFVNRNHYPDYLSLCLGLTAGLLIPLTRSAPKRRRPDNPYATEDPGWVRLITDPAALGLTAALALMTVSLPFSQSRGGVVGAVAAGGGAWLLSATRKGGGPGTRVRMGVGAVVGGCVLLAVWIGGGALLERFGNPSDREVADDRSGIWRAALRLVPGTWPAGIGADTFQWAEPTVRSEESPFVIYDSVHNEYLEALTEGGVVRFAFTLVLVGGTLWGVGRAYHRRADPAGPLLLGAWYGLAALAVHSFFDFGVRIPAVALLAAVVAGYAVGVADEPPPEPERRSRSRSRRSAAASPGPDRSVLRGPAAVAAAAGVVVAAAAAAADARSRAVEGWYRAAAGVLNAREELPEFQVPYEVARVAARPDDTDAQTSLADADMAAASQTTIELGQVVAGAAAIVFPPVSFPPPLIDKYAADGLRAARAARAACPLNTRAHQLLGTYGGAFVRAEPAVAHFERAKRLLSTDPFTWYQTGLDAYDRDDYPTAWVNWRGSLARGTAYQGPILQKSLAKLSVAEFRDRVLPDDPAAILAVANALYPDPERSAADRRPFLELAAGSAGRAGLSVPELRAVVDAEVELGDPVREAAAWERLLKAAPKDLTSRAEFTSRTAARLEADERYAEALPHLEALVALRPGDAAARFRVTAAKHGIDLANELK